MRRLILLTFFILLICGCTVEEKYESKNEGAIHYNNNACHIFYPDNLTIQANAKYYCDISEKEEVIDYEVSQLGDFLVITYPDSKTYMVNKDYSDISLKIIDKKMLSELFIYEFKKSEDDRAYTTDFLINNHYTNINIDDFKADFIDGRAYITALNYDFTFEPDLAYSDELFGVNFGEHKDYVKPTYISNNRPVISLTFDDGPYYKTDQKLFELFDLYDSRCTFFIVGSRLTDSELENIKTGISLNNEYGSHSYGHDNIKGINLSTGIDTMIEPMNVLKEKFGYDMKVYRQPYGYRNYELEKALKDNYGLTSILWNVDSLDWKTKDKDITYNNVVSNINGSEIVLMHSLYDSTADACKTIVPYLIDSGYQLVTCSELINILNIDKNPVYGQ